MATPTVKYSPEDFTSDVPVDTEYMYREKCSRFDKELQMRWDNALEKGYFRYRLGPLATRVIQGPHGFVPQLNVKRATERRKPQEIKSTKQPYKPEDFNFNKIRPHEILMEMCPENIGKSPPVQNGSSQASNGTSSEEDKYTYDERGGKFQVIINISPLEYGNVLLVPSPELCQPQIATFQMIRVGVETLLLSASRAFRIGYNSLCAFASVNHLHMHAYYVAHKLPSEYWPSKEVVSGRIHETIGWPAQCFLLQLKKENYMDVIRDLYQIVKLLQDKDIAHNMFFTRGLTLGPNPQDDRQTVRLFLWPRRSSYGVKASDAFNGACCELGGHLPVKLEQRYKHLTDEECCALLENDSLPLEEYASLKKDIKNIFQ